MELRSELEARRQKKEAERARALAPTEKESWRTNSEMHGVTV